MGQSASSQREREEFYRRTAPASRRYSQSSPSNQVEDSQASGRRANAINTSSNERTDVSGPLQQSSSRAGPDGLRPLATFRRQVSAQSIPARGNIADDARLATRDQVLYEEERPLVNMEDLGMGDAPITHITASPMPRRRSVISRLGSRFVPRYSVIGTPNDEQNPSGEGRTLRRRLSDTSPPTPPDAALNSANRRFSILGSLSHGSPSSTDSRRRGITAPISGPMPLISNAAILPRDEETSLPARRRHRQGSSSGGSRLERVRRSISGPIESLFSLNTNLSSETRDAQDSQTPPRRPARDPMADDAHYLLPSIHATDTNIDLDEIQNESRSLEPGDQGMDVFPPVSESNERSPTWVERLAERAPAVRRESRRMPNLLRGRSSRLIRRDDEAPLSRILQLAAAAIAAQLSGTPEQAFSNLQAVGADGLDGSLNTLFQTLQNATTSIVSDNGASEAGANTSRPGSNLPPMNFMRVFRFVNSNTDTAPVNPRASSEGRGARVRVNENQDHSLNSLGDEGPDGRTVTLVVVGVRSVPSGPTDQDEAATAGPSLDALLSLPAVPSNNVFRTGAGGLLRHADGRSRFTHRRRASMSGVNTFPANYDSQRHQRMQSGNRNSLGGLPAGGPPGILPALLSESPPGPHPPPSTPADPGLSAYSSGTNTPSRRPSSASAAQHPPLPRQGSASQRLRESGIFPPNEDTASQNVRQRRRSDSEFARHRDLGAGAARRNGVVEPDDAPPQGRSWLIYVVGTNLSEDHPALATPSLFTDNPTYEDMLLLSSLLGPAKPPVASRDAVASAPGIYRVGGSREHLYAEAIQGNGLIQIAPLERCLVCLCDYEPNEEVRQLSKCSHLFHRECIDEWLTTGRNSCPLCRGQGVDEEAATGQEPMPSASSSSPPHII